MAKMNPIVKNKIIDGIQQDATGETKSENEYEALARTLEYQASILGGPTPPGTIVPFNVQSQQNALASTFRTFASTARRMAAQEREHRANLNGLLAEIQRKSQYI